MEFEAENPKHQVPEQARLSFGRLDFGFSLGFGLLAFGFRIAASICRFMAVL
jgi:hypothetical protein